MVLLVASLGVAIAFLFAFVWAVRTGQFDDTTTPSFRMLADEEGERSEPLNPGEKGTTVK